MTMCSGTEGDGAREQLISATLDISRAHLLLMGVVDWAPPPVRPQAEEVLRSLEQAMGKLREASVRLHLDSG